MSAVERFERELPVALSDVAGLQRPDYLTDILGRTARTRQRPAWASLERWLSMDIATARAPVARIPWRALAVLAALVLLGALVAVYAGSQQRRVPAPFGPAANGVIPFNADGDILVGDPVTGTTRLVVGGATNDYGPTFSPDGTRLAFMRAGTDCPVPGDDCPGGEDIVVAAADGSGARTISAEPLVGIRYAAWAPDSRTIVVSQGGYDVYRLVRIPVDGGEPQVIATDLEADWVVFRPPAGDEILVRGVVNGVFGLHRMSADGSDVRLLVQSTITGFDDNQDLNFPSYSPDGSRIYYNLHHRSTIEAWVMNADGSNQHRFNVDAPGGGWWEGEMAPSPDGRWVAMWRVSPGFTGRVWFYPSDGRGEGVAGPFVAGTAHWSWAPDSSHLLLNYNDPNEGDQVLIDPVTGEVTPLPWAADAEPDWQRQALP